MKRHLMYFKYVLRHKWFVLLACKKVKCSLWRAIIHDFSKFLPSEWFPYAECFYKPDGSKQYNETLDFNIAWLMHQHRNKHHHQFWVLKCDDGRLNPMPMPEKYIREMIADWIGAGMAIAGRKSLLPWYEENKAKIVLHDETRNILEQILRATKF